jgi:hypothetical protein
MKANMKRIETIEWDGTGAASELQAKLQAYSNQGYSIVTSVPAAGGKTLMVLQRSEQTEAVEPRPRLLEG